MSRILTLHDPQTAREYYTQGVWRTDTLYSLMREHARVRPNAYALRDSKQRLTWSQLAGWVDALAAHPAWHAPSSSPHPTHLRP